MNKFLFTFLLVLSSAVLAEDAWIKRDLPEFGISLSFPATSPPVRVEVGDFESGHLLVQSSNAGGVRFVVAMEMVGKPSDVQTERLVRDFLKGYTKPGGQMQVPVGRINFEKDWAPIIYSESDKNLSGFARAIRRGEKIVIFVVFSPKDIEDARSFSDRLLTSFIWPETKASKKR